MSVTRRSGLRAANFLIGLQLSKLLWDAYLSLQKVPEQVTSVALLEMGRWAKSQH